MSVWHDNFKNGNVELGNAWTITAGGLHIFRGSSNRMGKEINWLRGDNVPSTAGAKSITHPLVNSGQDFGVSIEWRYLFNLSQISVPKALFFWVLGTEPIVSPASGTQTGYLVYLNGNGNFILYRRDAGAYVPVITMDASWAEDLNEHEIICTREVSGANRFWRVYIDGVLAGGPINDATYNAGTNYGVFIDNRDRVGEILISS